jgi:prepilin-type N-terminal cleavage/methylation domain-containing protein
MGIRLIHKGQRGFTLIELLIVVAIAGFVTGGITLTIMQVFNMDAHTRNDMIAVYQVRQAGKLVSEDILEAQSVNASGGLGFPLTLTWTDYETKDFHEVIYTLQDNRLYRSESINLGDPTMTRVAEYIDPETSCVPVGDAFKFTVTATVGGQSKTSVYEVKPRSGSY